MKNVTIYFLLVTILLLFGERTWAQEINVSKVESDDIEWSEGTVILTDGKTLSGLLRFNTKTGLLAFESGALSKSFTARTVQAFDFFDHAQNKKRSFLSVIYKDPTPPETNMLGGPKKNKKPVSEQAIPRFYEILMEFKAFAILSTTGQLQVKTKAGSPPTYDGNTNMLSPVINSQSTEYSQTETLLIFDAEGNISPLLEVTNKEIDSSLFDRSNTKTKRLDTEVVEKYTTPHFEKLEAYAKTNKLSFKKKDDLLKILEFYKTIESN